MRPQRGPDGSLRNQNTAPKTKQIITCSAIASEIGRRRRSGCWILITAAVACVEWLIFLHFSSQRAAQVNNKCQKCERRGEPNVEEHEPRPPHHLKGSVSNLTLLAKPLVLPRRLTARLLLEFFIPSPLAARKWVLARQLQFESLYALSHSWGFCFAEKEIITDKRRRETAQAIKQQ